MRLKLLSLFMGIMGISAGWAQTASVTGTVVDSYTGNPISGATVTLVGQNLSSRSDAEGQFLITGANPGSCNISAAASGYYSTVIQGADLKNGERLDFGPIKLQGTNLVNEFYEEQEDLLFDEAALDDEESAGQAVASLTGANDNIYYNASNYNFSTMYFRFRGYDSQYQTTYINGLDMNDPIRGRFNYSSLGGMTSRAFRNKTTTIGLGAANYGFGAIGGSSNISTVTSDYAPGFNGSVAYTNSNYMLRAMATYSTGINSHGWGLTLSAIGRYANEGVVKGTFYNSGGLFLSLGKVFNPEHSLTLTAWGAPTERASGSATYQEAYDLAGSNLYNPNWGYYDGKKRSARVIESFDPTAMLTWLYKNSKGTTLTTSAMFRAVNYSTSAINWFNASDPRPDYYRNLPSYFLSDGEPTAQSEYIEDLWRHDESYRQINWDRLYLVNELNNIENVNRSDEDKIGSSYILEKRHSNNIQAQIGSTVNARINSWMTLQGGLSASYAKASYYKTIKDLLGGEFWLDIDPYSNSESTIVPGILQNDINNPNRRVGVGDKFGYNYDFNVWKLNAFVQNRIQLARWDVNYGMEMSMTQFYRDGHMRNGRAPENSYGRGETHHFDNAALKAGVTYKPDGRNYVMGHIEYGSYAPLIESIYIAPRIKDTAISNPQSERIFSVDASYGWNYSRFRGSITAYYTDFYDAIERTSFYDDNYSAFTNYVLSGVRRTNKGIELGMAYKILPSLTATLAGTVASYRYKNNPQGTRSFENGMEADTTQTIYLKNYRVGGTPQTAFNIGLDWAAPKSWFLGINASYMCSSYVKLAPRYHEVQPTLWESYPTEEALLEKMEEITRQDKMNNAFVLNLSIGKLLYINRKVSMNFNLNIDNVLNNRNIQNNVWQQGRLDTKNWDVNKYPNKISYAQGTKVFLNIGIRF
ncbi:MAG: TonB-dependent receptor [Bacteroides sp.]|nr:TonB-dependent receptor [Bacteroides sp.]